jgi:D-alanyl-D-alanine carboxypeptidase
LTEKPVNSITAIHEELGVPPDYSEDRQLPPQHECMNPVSAGKDIFGREIFMDAATLTAWKTMHSAALKDGVELQLVSGYRSIEYQKNLFLKKMQSGQSIDEILKVNAAPGYSEHHTGKALDLTCPGTEPLEESFEQTEAFAWLQKHAADYGFVMSFPRNNQFGLLYEPWHWCLRN